MALSPSTIDYHFGTLDGVGSWSEWLRAQGREPVHFGHRARPTDHASFGWAALSRLGRYVRSREIDIVYVCGIRAAFALRLLRARMPGVRIVHGVRWNPASSSRLDVSLRLVERVSHGLIDGYIANSQIAARTLTERCAIPGERVHVIYNGISELPPAVPDLTDRPFEVVTVANLRPLKGHREYLPAIRRVLETFPQARFVFVGRDDMSGEVQRAVAAAGLSPAITFAGFQPDVSTYIRRARIFVLPSISEGSPTTILESFAWGTPVVAYATDGVPELIADGRDGYVVPAQNVEQLAARISELLLEPARAKQFGLEGHSKVASHFTLERTAARHDAVLTAIARPQGTSRVPGLRDASDAPAAKH